jgi:choline dehydrogenase-like flavoprotein
VLNDLRCAETDLVEIKTQVCIIGAGTAGIFLAHQLRKADIQVVLLEAGDKVARSPESIGQHCIQKGIRYRGAECGRSFGLGGTSVLWGGQLIPLAPSDMEERPEVGFDAWPIDYSEVAAYFSHVKQRLGLSSDVKGKTSKGLLKYFPLLSKLDNDFDLRLSSWLPFRKRNFSKLFADDLRTDKELVVWLNASVTEFKFTQSSDKDTHQITAIHTKSTNGNTLVVGPDCVVVCAGALESTRLMLALDESSSGLITRHGAPLGRYFSDHLSVTCGQFECHDWRCFNLETAPIFLNGVMHTPRLEISQAAQQRLSLTSAFAHFTFVTHGETGFDVVRNFLRKRQGEQQNLGLSIAMVSTVVKDMTAMVFWRYFYRKLWIPRKADLLLQVDIEQMANWDSQLSLADEKDDMGRKRLVVDWRISPEDARIIRTVAENAIEAWSSSPLREIANLHLTLPDDFETFDSLYDVYHPTGTLRMGSMPSNSVIDANLRSWAFSNCYISSTAVFPSAGSANPGLTHLALTSRLADHLRKIIER